MVNDTMPIECLGLRVRTYNALKRANINTIGDLMVLSDEEILGINQIGSYALNDVKENIKKLEKIYEDTNQSGECILYCIDKRTAKEDHIIRFKNKDGDIVSNIAIEDTPLHMRIRRCLNKAGLHTVLQVINADMHLICAYNNNMGESSFDELIRYLKEITLIQYVDNCIERESIDVNKFVQMLYDDINSTYRGTLSYSTIKRRVDECEDIIRNYTRDSIYDKSLMEIIYDCPSFISAIGRIAAQIAASKPDGISITGLKRRLPKSFIVIDKSHQELMEIFKNHKIEYFNGKCMYSYHSIFEYVDMLQNERHKSMVLDRLNGMTLNRIARKHGVTRERVRQIVLKVLRGGTPVYEDRYIYWFEKYHFTRSEFLKIFVTTDKVYAYLNMIAEKGSLPVKDILTDRLATEDMIENVSELYRDAEF